MAVQNNKQLIALGICLFPAFVMAQSPSPTAEPTRDSVLERNAHDDRASESQLPAVNVIAAPVTESAYGPVYGYDATRSATATKTDTPLLETPQSVSVVTRERIEDQGATSLQDALNYAAGVRSDAYGVDSRTDNVRVRGAYPDEYRDGLRRTVGYYTSNTRVDPYTLERIEVLRGPSAMLYGQGSTAGVINMVSKRPLPEAQREIGVQLGSYGRKQIEADLTGPLTKDGDWLYRLVAVGRDSDTQVDYVPDDRRVLAPSLTWRPSAATSLTLQALWQKDHTGSTSQFFPWSGTVLPNPNGRIPTSRFIGVPGIDRYDSERTEIGWLFEHRLNDHWTVRQNLRFAHNDVDYLTSYADSFSNPQAPYIDPAQRMLNRIGYFEHRDNHMLTADQHAVGLFDTGPLRHKLLVGLDFTRFTETSQSASDSPPPIDVFDPVYLPYTPPALSDNPATELRQTGVYLQDQITINRWTVVAGLRHDGVTNSVEGADDDSDHAFSKRLGLMYLLDGGVAPYVSYSESFTPIAGTNLSGQRWKPMRGEQVEVGVKWEPPGQRLSVTAALYDLKEKNRQVPDPDNPLDSVQAGKTRTHGLELALVGRLLPKLDIAAHYNYIDIDDQLEAAPTHQIGIWGTRHFAIGNTPGFTAGLGMRYMSSFRDGNAPVTPAVTLYDAMLGFDSGSWRYALNVHNLTDETYVSTCLSRGDCWHGARRTVLVSARYRF